jgi:hypothetical protein
VYLLCSQFTLSFMKAKCALCATRKVCLLLHCIHCNVLGHTSKYCTTLQANQQHYMQQSYAVCLQSSFTQRLTLRLGYGQYQAYNAYGYQPMGHMQAQHAMGGMPYHGAMMPVNAAANFNQTRSCYNCGNVGHLSKDCPKSMLLIQLLFFVLFFIASSIYLFLLFNVYFTLVPVPLFWQSYFLSTLFYFLPILFCIYVGDSFTHSASTHQCAMLQMWFNGTHLQRMHQGRKLADVLLVWSGGISIKFSFLLLSIFLTRELLFCLCSCFLFLRLICRVT